MKKLLSIFALLMCMSITWAQNVAKIGSTEYATLQAAVDDAYDNMTGDVTIELIADIEAYTVVRQKSGLNLTIDGGNKTINGQILIDGMGHLTSETLMIKDINFTGTGTTVGFTSMFFISVPTPSNLPSPYTASRLSDAHNITIDSCSFNSTSTETPDNGLAAVSTSSGTQCNNLTVQNCTGTNLHSLVQVSGTTGLTVDGCTLTNSESFIGVQGGGGTYTVQNCNFSTNLSTGYGLRSKSNSAAEITLSGNVFSASNANVLQLGKGGGQDSNGSIYVESGEYYGNIVNAQSASATAEFVFTGGTYSSDVTPECAPGYAAYANGTVPETWTVGPMPKVAKIGSVEYTSLQAALDSAHANMTGDVTVELLKNITEVAIVHQKASLNLTIEGSNDTIVGQILVDGDGRASGSETLTIQNVAFYGNRSNFCKNNAGTDSLDAFIQLPSLKTSGWYYYNNKYNYAHNITVDNCTFTSTSTASDPDVVAFKVNSGVSGYNISLTNCTGENLHSLAQFTGVTGSNIDNCDLGNTCGSFANVSGGGGAHNFSNNTYTGVKADDGYAVRMVGTSSATITLNDNDFTAYKVLVLGKNGSYNPTGTINVESGEYNGVISKETVAASTAVFSFTGGIFDEDSATVASWCAPGYYAIENDPDTAHCTVYQMYTLIYNANGGTGTMDTIRVKVDASVSDRTKTVADCAFLPATSTDIFAIWNTKADSTGISFNPGAPIVLVSDTTLYAIWREGYTISYDANGGTGTIPSQNKVIGVDIILSDGTDGAGNYLITKTDSTLYRWNTTPDEAVGSTNYALGETYSTDAHLTLYAVWRLTLDMTMDSTDVVCYGENNGTDTVKIIGGEEPFQLVLSGAALTENDTVKNIMDRTYIFENLKPGSYTVTLTDVLGKDTITGTFTIAQPDTLIVETMTVPEKPCPLMGVGEYNVSMTTTGGNGDNHFAWTGAEDVDAMATTVVPGTDDRDSTYTVTVTVTDKKGCTATGTETFTVSPVIADDGTIHSNTKMTIDTIKQGIMQGCDTIIRDFGTPNFAFTNPAIDENILDTIYNDIPTNYPDSIFPVGYSTIIWTAVDTCGHEVTGEQVIYIYHYPCPSVDDAEGNTYNGVRVGCLCWTDRNMVSTKYSSNGNDIPNLMSYVSETFPDATENVAKFGYLYDWYAAADTVTNSIADIEATYAAGKHVQGVCPNGWYLPTDEDFKTLESVDAKDLRSTDLWLEGGGTNTTGFNAVPGGFYNCSTGRFEDAAGNAYYWSCHPVYDKATGAMIDYICEKIYNSKDYSRCNGFSVRCVLIYGE